MVRKQRVYTKEQYEEALRLRHEEGLGYRIIGEKIGASYTLIHGWCHGKGRPKAAWSKEEVEAYAEGARKRATGRKYSLESRRKMSETKMGKLNPMWKGDKVSIRCAYERAERWYGAECPPGHEIHHIDGNPWNNERSNIAFLTRKQHMELDGRLKKLIERNKP